MNIMNLVKNIKLTRGDNIRWCVVNDKNGYTIIPIDIEDQKDTDKFEIALYNPIKRFLIKLKRRGFIHSAIFANVIGKSY